MAGSSLSPLHGRRPLAGLALAGLLVLALLIARAPSSKAAVNASLDIVAGSLVYTASADAANSLTLSSTNTTYTFKDTGETITLSAAALAAGWTGNNTNTVSGPAASFSSIAVDLQGGSDFFNVGVLGASVKPLSVKGGGNSSDIAVIGTALNVAAPSTLSLLNFETVVINAAVTASTIRLQADVMNLAAALNAGAAGTVSLSPLTANRPISLGAETVAQLSLTDAELDRIVAKTLTIGDGGTGALEVKGVISPAGSAELALASGATITQLAPITAPALLVSSVTTTTLAANNDVDTFVARVTSGGLVFNDVDTLAVDTVSGVAGIVVTSGNARLRSGGSLTINRSLQVLGAGNSATLEAGGPVTQLAGSQAAIDAEQLQLLGSGPFTLTNAANALDRLAANSNGAISLVSKTDSLSVGTVGATSGIVTSDDAVTIRVLEATAGSGNLVLENPVSVGAGAVTLEADNLLGNNDALGGATATLTADHMALGAGSINVGGGSVTLQPQSAGVAVSLGMVGDGGGSLALDDAELDTIVANLLTIKTQANASILITAPVSTSGVSTLSLRATQAVEQTGAGAVLATANLAVRGPTMIKLEVEVGAKLAFQSSAQVQLAGGSMIIDTVDGITTSLALNQLVLTADALTILHPISTGSSTTQINPLTDGRPITLGAETAATLSLTDAELDRIQTSRLEIGDPGAGSISVAAAISPAGTSVLWLTSGGSIAGSGAITSADLLLSAVAGVNLSGTNDLNTVAGAVTGPGGFLIRDIDDLRTGAITTASGDVSISADTLDIQQAISAPGQIVTLELESPGRLINLGGEVPLQLSLTAGELNLISASMLRIGEIGAGSILVSAPLALTNVTTLSLATGGAVSGSAALIVDVLGITASTGVNLTGANDVNTFAATTTGAKARFVDVDDLTIGSVDQRNGIGTAGGDVDVHNGGALVVSQPVAAASGTITVTVALGDALLSNNAAISGARATLTADRMALGGGTISVGSGASNVLSLLPLSAGRPVNLGGATDPTGVLSLSDAELDTLTAGLLRVGQGDSGDVTIAAALSPASVEALSLSSGGALLDANTTGVDVAVESLALRFANGIASIANPLEANLLNLAFLNLAGGEVGVSSPSLTLDAVDGLASARNQAGAIALWANTLDILIPLDAGAARVMLSTLADGRAIELGAPNAGALSMTDEELDRVTAGTIQIGGPSAGTIALSAAVTPAGTTTVVLQAEGAIGGAGSLTVANLLLSAASVNLPGANDVDTLAGRTNGSPGAFAFGDADDLTVGTLESVSGVATTSGNITLKTGGALTLDKGLTANGGATITLDAGGSVTQAGDASAALASQQLALLGAGPFALTNPGNGFAVLGGDTTGAITLVDSPGASDLTIAKVPGILGGSSVGLATADADVSVTVLGGDLTIAAGVALGGGVLTLTTTLAEGIITNNADVEALYATLSADRMALGGGTLTASTTNPATPTVLQPVGPGRPIRLGDEANPTGSLSLGDAELDHVVGRVVQVGSDASGAITIVGTTAPQQIDVLVLRTGAAVVDANTSGDDLRVANLVLHAADGIGTSANSLDLNVGGLAFHNTTAGDASFVNTSTRGDPTLVVGVPAVDAAPSGNAAGPVSFTGNAGISIVTATSASGGMLIDATTSITVGAALSAGGNMLLDGSGRLSFSAPVTATGDLVVDDQETAAVNREHIVLDSRARLRSTGGDITLTAGDRLLIGAGARIEAPAGNVQLSSGDGDGDGDGAQTLSGAISAAAPDGTIAIRLNNTRGVSQGTGGSLRAAQLSIQGTGPLGVAILNQPGNDVDVLAANLVAGLSYRDADDLAVATVGLVDGISTSGNVALTGTTMTIKRPIMIAGGANGSLTLTGTGLTIEPAGDIAVEGAFAQIGSGPVSLGGDVLSENEGVSFQGPVTLSADVVLSAAAPGVTFGAGLTALSHTAAITTQDGFTLVAGTTLSLRLNSASDFGRLVVTGGVNLNGARLALGLNFAPPTGTRFTLIDNDGSDAVIGRFNGLSEGASITLGGKRFIISYIGGDGNDVVLSYGASIPSRTYLPLLEHTPDA